MVAACDLPADVVRRLFQCLTAREVYCCSAVCRAWLAVAEGYAWPSAGTRAGYVDEQRRRARWRTGGYRSGVLNSLLTPCDSFRVCGDRVLTSHWSDGRPAVAIYDLPRAMAICSLREAALCFDLRGPVLVLGGNHHVIFYDARRLPTEVPTEVHRQLTPRCTSVHILNDGRVLTAHLIGTLQLWEADGRFCRQLLDGDSSRFWEVVCHPHSPCCAVLTGALLQLGSHNLDHWKTVYSAGPTAFTVLWDVTGPRDGLTLLAYSTDRGCVLVEWVRFTEGMPGSSLREVVHARSTLTFCRVAASHSDSRTTVAAATDQGEVLVWRSVGLSFFAVHKLRSHGQPASDLLIHNGVVCAVDTHSSAYIWNICKERRCGDDTDAPEPEPTYIINHPFYLQNYHARLVDPINAKAAVRGDYLVIGPQALTQQVQLLRFGVGGRPLVDAVRCGPPLTLRHATAAFITLLLATLLSVLSVALQIEGVPWAKFAAVGNLGFSVGFIVLLGVQIYSPLSPLTSGFFFFCGLAFLLSVALYLFLFVVAPVASIASLYVVYGLVVAWRAYYGGVLKTRVYGNRWCSCSLPRRSIRLPGQFPGVTGLIACMMRWYRTSITYRLFVLFSYDIFHFAFLAVAFAVHGPVDGEPTSSDPGWVYVPLIIYTVAFSVSSYQLIGVFSAALVTKEPVAPARFFVICTYVELSGLLFGSFTVMALRASALLVVPWVALLTVILVPLTLYRHVLQRRVCI